ncbi:hypothetical protein [Spirosoma utsteinense]|uniref:Uncharacterized protein n=1 Tax=Spirosoma utsteinense TaxID=2585773 RepID=A0ABR6W8Y9_9BACT|nr:hypothetical protein [Spirosoma utsteinense]MBC3787401.1 hypothetical protein [Spirosoma utsteinense]MBC3793044.1 hypothetical protein [Spirosoma utsteinense]
MTYRPFLNSLVALPLLMDACQNPIEGIQIRVKDPLEAGIVECRLYDPAGNPLPKTSRILMAGPDAGQVVTTLNTTRYKINPDGVLLLAPSPDAVLSPQDPFRFTIVVEADDYLTVVQPVTLTNANRVTRTVRQISLSKPPRTLMAARTTGRAGTDGTVSGALSLTTAEKSSDADRASVLVSSGTTLADRDGVSLKGNLTLSVIHTNTRTGDATSQVPGGGILGHVNGLDGGASLGTLRVTSMAGSVTMEMYDETYRLAKKLSRPLRWTMDLNPATINGSNGRVIQAGDIIPLYSYDAVENRWQQEKPGTVLRNGSRLTYQAEASHLAAYVATWSESVCDLGPVFRVNSKLANVDVNYLCKLIDAGSGAQVSSFYANVNNGAQIRIANQVKGRRLTLRVYDETDAWGKGVKGGMIAESAIGTACDLTPVSINLAGLPVPPVMKVEIKFSCPGGTSLDESALPAQIRTQYSEAGKENWRELITATRLVRTVSSYKIQPGRKYDFRASTDGGATWPLRQNDYLIDDAEWVLKISASMYCK